jgi:hypothetical protein
MLIDEFLPKFDVFERHQIDIRASSEQVYATVRELDMSNSILIRGFFRLRGLPTLFSSRKKSQQGLGLKLEGLLQSGLVLLSENSPQELALGLAGKFWTTSGCIQRLDATGFQNFTAPGYAKAVWNFSLSPLRDGMTRLSTETRVLCLDETSRRRFRFYWLFIQPFSGLVRREALRAIKQQTVRSDAFSRLAIPETGS